MKELRLKPETCNKIYDYFCENRPEVRVLDNVQSLFNYLIIKDMRLKQEIEEELSMSFLVLRVHEFKNHHFADKHTDTSYPDYSTAVINIRNKERVVRFHVASSPGDVTTFGRLHEKGQGILMPPKTYHKVTKGDDLIYTLCGWTLNPGVEWWT